MILLSFSNWNACVSVPVEPTSVPSTVYVKPAKSTVRPSVPNLPCGAFSPLPVLLASSVIVSPSTAAFHAASSVRYFVPPICATYSMAASVLVPSPLETHSKSAGAACVNVSALVTSPFSGVASITAAAVSSMTMSPFIVPPASVRLKPSFGSATPPVLDVDTSTSPLITESPVTVTLTDG